LLCPHRLGRNSARQARVLCYQYGGESSTELEPSGSLANWRCMKLEKFSRVEVLEGLWHTAPNHSARRPASPTWTWMPKIIRTASHTADSEAEKRRGDVP
jgi:hypothetical protein